MFVYMMVASYPAARDRFMDLARKPQRHTFRHVVRDASGESVRSGGGNGTFLDGLSATTPVTFQSNWKFVAHIWLSELLILYGVESNAKVATT